MSPSDRESGRACDQLDLSSLFTRRYKHAGRDISRPMWFYISLNKNGYAATKRLIINHGGKVSAELGDTKFSKEICLIDPHAKASRDGRPAYSVDYIQSCVTAKRLLNIEEFRIAPVGRTRKTPSKQHCPNSNPNPSPQDLRRNPAHRTVPELTHNGDSEVTDDLPCIAQLENSDEIHERPIANGQGTKGIPAEKTQPGRTENTTPKRANDGDRSEGQRVTQARQESRRPDLVAPKKRRSFNRMTETVEKNEGKDVQMAPDPAITPIKSSMTWSKEEDDLITDLCMEAKQTYHLTNRDPNKVFTLKCWLGLEKEKLLPDGRSAAECFARAKHLWENGEAAALETAKEVETQGAGSKRARVLPPQNSNPGVEDEIREGRDHPGSHCDPQAVPQRHEAEQLEPERLNDASRHETREYIFELVSRIAKRGRVTKRSAFRALREERGHWKRALRLVTRRKGRSNA